MGAYTDVFRGPARSLLITATLARLTFGIEGLAFLVYVEERTGSFATAGLVIAAFGVTAALLAVPRGMLVDRGGSAVMLALVAGYAGSNTIAALVGPSGPEALNYVVLGLLAGAFAPPLGGWTRSALAVRMRDRELQAVYSVDGALEEGVFIVGPLLAGLMIALWSAQAAIILGAVLVALGSVAMLYMRSTRQWRPPPHEPRSPERPRVNGRLLVVFATLAGAGLTIALFEVGVTAFAEDRGQTPAAGALIAAFSVAGVIGSVIYGTRSWRGRESNRYLAALAWVAAGMALLPVAGSTLALGLLALVPGLAFTTVFIINSLLVVEHAARATITAFSGVSIAVNGGFAIGGGVGGAVAESAGTDLVFLLGAAAMAVSALVFLPLALRPASAPV